MASTEVLEGKSYRAARQMWSFTGFIAVTSRPNRANAAPRKTETGIPEPIHVQNGTLAQAIGCKTRLKGVQSCMCPRIL